ncbi:AP endonuclease [Jaminaea rosea]|uniref:Apurinic-apyrimidinic endonuclease 1 n=1 Tax=Jaminaea rosea TaxID=1569628 RepID=A0A316UNE2_9BASI|nr:AP endonuclease [Jaminaea rosea]PWN26780.1 AP endonuclease [Jaminaea rosea]
MSIADGVENSIASARRYACEGFALFLKAKMNWTYKPLAQENIDRFRRWLPALGYTGKRCLPHGSYLINLGNPNNVKRAQAMDSFLDDLRRCALLGISVYNFHPGSGVGECTKEQACTNIATCINEAHLTLAKENLSCPIILLENMAGQGQQVGRYFEELADVIAQVRDKGKVGVCLDTAHAFAAGFDIHTIAGFNAMMADFDRIIGAQYLHGMHLNDSKEALGSRKDRHENIGQGHIGLAPFWCIMNQERFAGMPLVLETPAASWRVWKGEIEALYELQGLPEEEGAWRGVKEKLKALSELPKEMAGTDIAKAGLPPKPYKDQRTKGEGDKKGATGKTAQAKVKKATAVKKEILRGQALQHATDELAIDRPAADGGLAPKRKRKAL